MDSHFLEKEFVVMIDSIDFDLFEDGEPRYLNAQEIMSFVQDYGYLIQDEQMVFDFFTVDIMLNNQMESIFEDYKHEGWSITSKGIKEKGSERIAPWTEIAEKLEEKAIYFEDYEELVENFKKIFDVKTA